MLKIAVFAPMPSASAKIATAANPGFLRSRRKPKRVSRRKFAMLALSFSAQGNRMNPGKRLHSRDRFVQRTRLFAQACNARPQTRDHRNPTSLQYFLPEK